MDLKTYLTPLDAAAREQFAKRCESTRGHLQNVMYGARPCATDLAVAIERESEQALRRWDLRPNDWWRHWPELIDAEGAPAVPSPTAAE